MDADFGELRRSDDQRAEQARLLSVMPKYVTDQLATQFFVPVLPLDLALDVEAQLRDAADKAMTVKLRTSLETLLRNKAVRSARGIVEAAARKSPAAEPAQTYLPDDPGDDHEPGDEGKRLRAFTVLVVLADGVRERARQP